MVRFHFLLLLVFVPCFAPFSISQESYMAGNDGKQYKTLLIGNQEWMAENLRETKYRNGDEIPEVFNDDEWKTITAGARCSNIDNESYTEIYGFLYNWHALTDKRDIAPEGWRVPTDDDWKKLEMHLGMSRRLADQESFRGTNEGSRLAGNAGLWITGNLINNPEFNSSGFAVLPGGYRSSIDGTFIGLGKYALFWTASEKDDEYAWYRYLCCNNSDIVRLFSFKNDGFSVRLIRE